MLFLPRRLSYGISPQKSGVATSLPQKSSPRMTMLLRTNTITKKTNKYFELEKIFFDYYDKKNASFFGYGRRALL
jgi:hypothetical protein